jgi:hypothetical protein
MAFPDPGSKLITAHPSGGLEQLNRVTGWILQQDLLAAIADHDLVAEASSRGFEPRNGCRQVLDLDADPVPAAWGGELAVGHGLSGSASAWSVEQQPKRPTRDVRKPGRGLQIELKSEETGVKGDGRIDVGHDVAHAHVSHHSPPVNAIRLPAVVPEHPAEDEEEGANR